MDCTADVGAQEMECLLGSRKCVARVMRPVMRVVGVVVYRLRDPVLLGHKHTL
jgi:hypothetical protein